MKNTTETPEPSTKKFIESSIVRTIIWTLLFLSNIFVLFGWHPFSVVLFDRETTPGLWKHIPERSNNKSRIGAFPYPPTLYSYAEGGVVLKKVDGDRTTETLVNFLAAPDQLKNTPMHEGIWCIEGFISCYKDGVANSLSDKLFLSLFRLIKGINLIKDYYRVKAALIFTTINIALNILTLGQVFKKDSQKTLIDIQKGIVVSYSQSGLPNRRFFSALAIKLLSVVVPIATFAVNSLVLYVELLPWMSLYQRTLGRGNAKAKNSSIKDGENLPSWSANVANSDVSLEDQNTVQEDPNIEEARKGRNFQSELFDIKGVQKDSYYSGEPQVYV